MHSAVEWRLTACTAGLNQDHFKNGFNCTQYSLCSFYGLIEDYRGLMREAATAANGETKCNKSHEAY